MNLLPSLLVATTIIGCARPIQIGNCTISKDSILQHSNNSCIAEEVIIGNSCDAESILDTLNINLGELLNNCLRPTLPDTENTPGTEDTPDIEDTPDLNLPEDEILPPAPEQPDNEGSTIPEQKPEQKPEQDNTIKPEELPDTDKDTSNKNYIEQVVALVNKERAKVSLPALTMSEKLNKAARIRAVETAKLFSHTRPNGSSFASVLSENNISYRGAGENIAWGQKTPEEVVNAWMNSSGHRANILGQNFTTIGVGYYLDNGRAYWAQLFIH